MCIMYIYSVNACSIMWHDVSACSQTKEVQKAMSEKRFDETIQLRGR